MFLEDWKYIYTFAPIAHAVSLLKTRFYFYGRGQLIEIAAKLFSERGFENTPLSVIGKTANVSRESISHQFKSKNILFWEMFLKTDKLIA